MTNQQFKDLLESNGIKTREHQFFDFECGNISVSRINLKGEMQVFVKSIVIFFTDAYYEEDLLCLAHNGTTVSFIPKSELL